MSAPLLMVAATLLFATMGMCVKVVSADYSTGEIVFYRGMVGVLMIMFLTRVRGGKFRGTLHTKLPAMHFWRSLTGVSALGLWFYAIGELPLPTAVTLNYMAPVWMATFLIGGSFFLGRGQVNGHLVWAVLGGFAGVVCVLQPVLGHGQLWAGLMGLLSGLLTGVVYLQVTALGRAGEPESRIVFYFSIASIGGGAVAASFASGWHSHTPSGLAMLLAVGFLATIAQLLVTRAYAIGRLLVNGSLQYLGIAWAYLYGVLLFDDKVTGAGLLGMGLIILAGIGATRLHQGTTLEKHIKILP